MTGWEQGWFFTAETLMARRTQRDCREEAQEAQNGPMKSKAAHFRKRNFRKLIDKYPNSFHRRPPFTPCLVFAGPAILSRGLNASPFPQSLAHIQRTLAQMGAQGEGWNRLA
jgi:hypothetical protein